MPTGHVGNRIDHDTAGAAPRVHTLSGRLRGDWPRYLLLATPPGSYLETPKKINSKPDTRHPKSETRKLKIETRNPKTETRKPKPNPETRKPKPETRNSKPETRCPKLRNPKLET